MASSHQRALEAMLNSSVAALEGELAILRTLVLGVLDGLERNIGASAPVTRVRGMRSCFSQQNETN